MDEKLLRALALVTRGLACASVLIAGVATADPGDLDPSFGNGGKVRTSLSRYDDSAGRIVVQDDGKIVTVGVGARGGERDLLLARFLPDGDLDTSFGSGGRVFFGFKKKTERGAAIALQPDGRIVVTAQVEKGEDTARMLVARFLVDGSYDPSFGQKGRVTTAFDGIYLSPAALLVTKTGEILVGGQGFVGGLTTSKARAWILARYDANGRLDRSFGDRGRVVMPLGNGLSALAEQADGKIVAGGSAGPGFVDFAVARLLGDGSLDPTFADGGIAVTSFGSGNDYVEAIAIDGSGRIVAAGRTWRGVIPDIALARYLPDGSPDPSFGSGGKVTTDVGHGANEGYGLLVADDGRMVVAGWALVGRRAEFQVVRYLQDGTLDQSFGDGGVVLTAVGPLGAQAVDVKLQGADRLIVSGAAVNGKGTSDTALVRYEW